jgi:hypothetical protein
MSRYIIHSQNTGIIVISGARAIIIRTIISVCYALDAVLRIRDVHPGSNFFPSRIPYQNCLHPWSASKNLSILTKKNGCEALENIIRVVHPGSGCWLSTHPGSRGQKGTGSRIRIRNTDKIFRFRFAADFSFLSPYCKLFTEPRNRIPGRYDNHFWRTGPPGYISWLNRFLDSLNVYKYGLCRLEKESSALWRG